MKLSTKEMGSSLIKHSPNMKETKYKFPCNESIKNKNEN